MLIYNVTIQVNRSIATQWLQWMKQEHIPEVMQTGCFEKFQMVKVLGTDESEGLTYAVQYYASTQELLDRYLQEHTSMLRQKSFEKWGDLFIAFRTIMEVVN